MGGLLTRISVGVSVQEGGVLYWELLLAAAPVSVGDFPRLGTGAAWGAKEIGGLSQFLKNLPMK